MTDLEKLNDSCNRLWARTGAYETALFAIIKTYPTKNLAELQAELTLGLEMLKATLLGGSLSEPAVEEIDATADRLQEQCRLVLLQRSAGTDDPSPL